MRNFKFCTFSPNLNVAFYLFPIVYDKPCINQKALFSVVESGFSFVRLHAKTYFLRIATFIHNVYHGGSYLLIKGLRTQGEDLSLSSSLILAWTLQVNFVN